MHRRAVCRRQGIDIGQPPAITPSRNAIEPREALPDNVGAESVVGRGRDPVQVQDGDEGPKARGTTVTERLRVHPIEY